ncbi:MAG: hypothetical protein ACHQU1_10010 [Gemmatimonadales bacterium]
MIAVLVLLALVVLRLVVLGGLAWALLPRGRTCPACGAETVALERTGLVRMVPGVTRRWCVECGWSWFRKVGRRSPAVPSARLGAMSWRS